MSEIRKVLITALVRDVATQPRTAIQTKVVKEYAERMVEGDTFPPIRAFEEATDAGPALHLADGWHRSMAAEAAGQSEILAEVSPGSARDARLYAAQSNAANGLPRTNEDKVRAVTIMLEDQEWSGWADREIARHVRVGPDIVGRLRSKLSVGQRQTERMVRRGDAVFTMKTDTINADRAVTEPPERVNVEVEQPAAPAPANDVSAPTPAAPVAAAKEQPDLGLVEHDYDGAILRQSVIDAIIVLSDAPAPKLILDLWAKFTGNALPENTISRASAWVQRFAADFPKVEARRLEMVESLMKRIESNVA